MWLIRYLSDFNQKDYVSPRRILVQLLNTKSTLNESDFYKVSVSNLGDTLNIHWNESLGLPILIEALTVSFIQSYGYSVMASFFLINILQKHGCLRDYLRIFMYH